MNAPVARPQIAAFVERVRAELDDLSPEEVDEITEGLEADLNDAQTDAGAPDGAELPDPVAYAAELRSAAGLPPRAAPGATAGAGFLAATVQLRQQYRDVAATVRAQRWWPPLWDFVRTLRPVWWVGRALVASLGLAVVFGLASWPLALVLAVVSVELGRRDVVRRAPAWRSAIAVGNAVAVLGMVMMTSTLLRIIGGPAEVFAVFDADRQVDVTPSAPSSGLWMDGSEVRNVFPYDGAGHPLSGVQLYDQDGRPLSVGDVARAGEATTDGNGSSAVVVPVPAVDQSGQQRWNVFPLRQRADRTDGTSDTTVVGTPGAAALPTVRPGPLIVPPASGSAATGSAATGSAATGSAASGSAASSRAPSPSPSTSSPVPPSTSATPSRAG